MLSEEEKFDEIQLKLTLADVETYNYSFDEESCGFSADSYREVYQFCDASVITVAEEMVDDDGVVYLFTSNHIQAFIDDVLWNRDTIVLVDGGGYRVCFLDTLFTKVV